MFGIRRQTYKLDLLLPFPPQAAQLKHSASSELLHASFVYLFYLHGLDTNLQSGG